MYQALLRSAGRFGLRLPSARCRLSLVHTSLASASCVPSPRARTHTHTRTHTQVHVKPIFCWRQQEHVALSFPMSPSPRPLMSPPPPCPPHVGITHTAHPAPLCYLLGHWTGAIISQPCAAAQVSTVWRLLPMAELVALPISDRASWQRRCGINDHATLCCDSHSLSFSCSPLLMWCAVSSCVCHADGAAVICVPRTQARCCSLVVRRVCCTACHRHHHHHQQPARQTQRWRTSVVHAMLSQCLVQLGNPVPSLMLSWQLTLCLERLLAA